MENSDRHNSVYVCFWGQGRAQPHETDVPASSLSGTELSGGGWFLLCSVLLTGLQTVPPGACMTPWILLMSPYLQLRSIENAESTGRAGWADHRLCLCGCHLLLSGSRKLWGSSWFPAEHSFLKNKNLFTNAWSARDCCYIIPSQSL